MKNLHTILLFQMFALAMVAQPSVPDGILFEKGIEFSNADAQHLQLNLARPKKAPGLRPAVICIHGGGFRAGQRERYDQLCLKLAARGYCAATVTYRLAPAFQFPAAVIDCKAAVRWLRAHAAEYGVDPDRIGVLGESAGGHLAQFLGVTSDVREFDVGDNLDQSSAVTCVVNYFGPCDLVRLYGPGINAHIVLPLFFGGDLSTRLKAHVRGSPLAWVTPNAAPTLVLQGTEDDHVPYPQAGWLVERMSAAQVEIELITFAGARHGFKGDDAVRAEAAAFAFLDRHLQP